MVEILRHSVSGELYAAAYQGGMSLAALSSIVGPVDASTALDMVRDGYDIPVEAVDDIGWALEQHWSALSMGEVERAADCWS